MAWGDKLVARGTSFGLRALRGKQVPEAGRAANQLSGSGNFEALGDGKLIRRTPGFRHLLSAKSTKSKRRASRDKLVAPGHAKPLLRALPFGL